ncbi:MAG: TRAP transporter large permease [Thermodesulfobacteriota bacterium]|nr:TRAP transporter large permease [Thermodesulfobacteriota bacterium]
MSLAFVGVIGIISLLFILFFFGMPVGFSMAIVGFAGFSYVINLNAGLNMTGSVFWSVCSNYGLTVIPLFIFMGQIAFYSGVNKRLYKAAHQWVGHIRGGLAMATIMACSAFAAICGSNTATAATMSTVALPEMKKYGYSSILSTGAIACGSTLGVVIPPSVVLIIIGLATEQSIVKLFYGSIGAGILLTLLFVATIALVCRMKPEWGPVAAKSSVKEKIASLSGGIEMLILFFLIMAGLYIGFFTPSEAGAAGSFLALVISVVRKTLSWHDFKNAVKDTLGISCMVIMLIAGAMIFGRFLAITRIPFDLASFVAGLEVSDTMIMICISLIYIAGGAIMDALALLLITIPIFFPLAMEMGYDPIWFAVTITIITTLGAVTPPVGATTYVVAGIAENVPLKDVFKGVALFLPAYILTIILLIFFPDIITWLPGFI